MTGKEKRLENGGTLTYQYRKLDYALGRVARRRLEGCAVDIGAHCGLWSMWLARYFARLEAFEPVDALADIWPYNVPQSNATLHRVALGERLGRVSMKTPPACTGNSRVMPGEIGDVPMVTLDSLALRDVAFIKIDVEGYELPVVMGARETILENRPIIVLEQKGRDKIDYAMIEHAALKYVTSLGMTSYHCIGGDHILGWA
jgi:FkbM family methyltransferase